MTGLVRPALAAKKVSPNDHFMLKFSVPRSSDDVKLRRVCCCQGQRWRLGSRRILLTGDSDAVDAVLLSSRLWALFITVAFLVYFVFFSPAFHRYLRRDGKRVCCCTWTIFSSGFRAHPTHVTSRPSRARMLALHRHRLIAILLATLATIKANIRRQRCDCRTPRPRNGSCKGSTGRALIEGQSKGGSYWWTHYF